MFLAVLMVFCLIKQHGEGVFFVLGVLPVQVSGNNLLSRPGDVTHQLPLHVLMELIICNTIHFLLYLHIRNNFSSPFLPCAIMSETAFIYPHFIVLQTQSWVEVCKHALASFSSSVNNTFN